MYDSFTGQGESDNKQDALSGQHGRQTPTEQFKPDAIQGASQSQDRSESYTPEMLQITQPLLYTPDTLQGTHLSHERTESYPPDALQDTEPRQDGKLSPRELCPPGLEVTSPREERSESDTPDALQGSSQSQQREEYHPPVPHHDSQPEQDGRLTPTEACPPDVLEATSPRVTPTESPQQADSNTLTQDARLPPTESLQQTNSALTPTEPCPSGLEANSPRLSPIDPHTPGDVEATCLTPSEPDTLDDLEPGELTDEDIHPMEATSLRLTPTPDASQATSLQLTPIESLQHSDSSSAPAESYTPTLEAISPVHGSTEPCTPDTLEDTNQLDERGASYTPDTLQSTPAESSCPADDLEPGEITDED